MAFALTRLETVGADALILYDVDAESDRSAGPRPFPYLPMMDPANFHRQHLAGWTGPVIVYRAVGKYAPDDLGDWLTGTDPRRVLTVLVGASSRHQQVKTRLTDAYRLHAGLDQRPGLGGVFIAERHAATGREHERMLSKQAAGCEFFVSQVCYDVDHTRDVLSDYAYACRDSGLTPRPAILTLAPSQLVGRTDEPGGWRRAQPDLCHEPESGRLHRRARRRHRLERAERRTVPVVVRPGGYDGPGAVRAQTVGDDERPLADRRSTA